MKRLVLSGRLLLAAALLGMAAPSMAQEVAAAAETDTATDGTALGVIDRWRADPGTIFEGSEIDLAALKFVARPLVVFADSPADPNFVEQMALLAQQSGDLRARDVILITDTDPAARSALRLELRPRGFALVLIGKDGRVAQRKPAPWSVRELARAIDKMPLRQQEIRDGTHSGG